MWSIAKAMKDALEATGYSELREYQRKTIEAYVSGRDVFVSAPTGGGKSLTFELAPYTFDRLFGEDILNVKEKIVLGSPEAILNNYQHIFRHLKRNHLKSLLETTFTQSKQICSFDDGDTHTHFQ